MGFARARRSVMTATSLLSTAAARVASSRRAPPALEAAPHRRTSARLATSHARLATGLGRLSAPLARSRRRFRATGPGLRAPASMIARLSALGATTRPAIASRVRKSVRPAAAQAAASALVAARQASRRFFMEVHAGGRVPVTGRMSARSPVRVSALRATQAALSVTVRARHPAQRVRARSPSSRKFRLRVARASPTAQPTNMPTPA